MNKKGQALIEFIIIFPIIIYIIMIIVDFMVIFSNKNLLESNMNEIVELYKDNKLEEIYKYNNNFTYTKDETYTYLETSINYNTISPGLSNILGNPYKIKCERVIINE